MPMPAIAMALAVLRGNGRLTAQVVEVPQEPQVRCKLRDKTKQNPLQKSHAKAIMHWAKAKACSTNPFDKTNTIENIPTSLPDAVRANILNILLLLDLVRL
jgi:hypothetical protein